MDVRDVARILLYDEERFEMYLNYHDQCDNNRYLSFEEFLLFGNNLNDYLKDEEKVFKKYTEYHSDDEIHDYECFELFCKSFNMFPFDEEKLKDCQKCENCIHFGMITSLLTGDEDYGCTYDEIYRYFNHCDYHRFDTNKAKPLVRERRRVVE